MPGDAQQNIVVVVDDGPGDSTTDNCLITPCPFNVVVFVTTSSRLSRWFTLCPLKSITIL